MPKTLSGKKVINILCRRFGFYFVSQKGSHVKLEKKIHTQKVVTIVPLHKELAHGTLRGALELARIDEKEFWKKYKPSKYLSPDGVKSSSPSQCNIHIK
ncbi:MAG: type II toxin-antitoxin system HicA family toxin [Candidatus Sungbacteria bacterium]|nr:type II toxin-antitoxin system HicA family toxin [Candidatus Sungbacteria bacterium]